MTQTLVTDRPPLRPLHVVMIGLMVVVVGGGFLLLSSPESTKLMEGAVPWREESPLRALVQLLCLNYSVPTINPGTIKVFLLGVGSGLGTIALALAVATRGRGSTEPSGVAAPLPSEETGLPHIPVAPVVLRSRKAPLEPLAAAQLLTLMYLLWSFASCRWSTAPELALGGSILLAIQWLWALALGLGLNARAARVAASIVLVVTGITAVIAVWYYYGRNPGLRAMFPLGNPLFLSSCLIPGLILSGCHLGFIVRDHQISSRRLFTGLGMLLTIVLALWAFYLANSRSSAVGLAAGVLGAAFFAMRGRWKLVPLAVAVAGVVAGSWYFVAASDIPSTGGRDATLRLRQYAWRYSWQMFGEKPLTGHGQGGFVLKGDSYAANDVLADPQVFEARIDHAHNEWLETMSDLGAVGIILISGVLLITLRIGALTLRRARAPMERWTLVGLLGGLVGLIVSEGFSVGLRVSGVANIFCTLIGLIWAMAGDNSRNVLALLTTTPFRRGAVGIVGVGMGMGLLAISHADWSAARDEYIAEIAFQRGEPEEAVVLSARSVRRLNPQRALTSLARLSEAHLRAAVIAQERADDRVRRAFQTEPPNNRLAALAMKDYQISDEHCQAGAHAIKELVSRSPGFIHHGRIEFQMNLARARNGDSLAHLMELLPELAAWGDVSSVNDRESRDRFVAAALKAMERELVRQPFDPLLASEYVQVAGAGLAMDTIITAIARPLRHHRLGSEYVAPLSIMAGDPAFLERFVPLVDQAVSSLTKATPLDEMGRPIELWAPERLRLAAAIHFLRGEYPAACDLLEIAVLGYEGLMNSAPIGAASCLAELADARFFRSPLNPAPAIDAANRAIELAPGGARGGELRTGVQKRLMNYYLASGEEERARRLLRDITPQATEVQSTEREIGVRYWRLCDSLLSQLTGGEFFVQIPSAGEANNLSPPTAPNQIELINRLRSWSKRALELVPDDAHAHRVAARISLVLGHVDECVAHLSNALARGLEPTDARAFLDLALSKHPTSEPLLHLMEKLDESAQRP